MTATRPPPPRSSCSASSSLAAYVDRVYSEMGKFLAREYQDNIDAWEAARRAPPAPRPRIHRPVRLRPAPALARRHRPPLRLRLFASIAFGSHGAMAEIAITLFEAHRCSSSSSTASSRRSSSPAPAASGSCASASCSQALFYLILPITLLLGLLLSIVALAEPEDTTEEEHPSEAMDALLEAGEEEGILEESDRELVRSVVEFGDKVVREVMTPRPEIFAVPDTLTLRSSPPRSKNTSSPASPSTATRSTTSPASPSPTTSSRSPTRRRHPHHRRRSSAPPPSSPRPRWSPSSSARCSARSSTCASSSTSTAASPASSPSKTSSKPSSATSPTSTTRPEEDDAPIREPDGAYVVSGTFELSRLRELFADQFPRPASDADERRPGRRPDARRSESDDATALRLPEHYESTTVGGLVSRDRRPHPAPRRGRRSRRPPPRSPRQHRPQHR